MQTRPLAYKLIVIGAGMVGASSAYAIARHCPAALAKQTLVINSVDADQITRFNGTRANSSSAGRSRMARVDPKDAFFTKLLAYSLDSIEQLAKEHAASTHYYLKRNSINLVERGSPAYQLITGNLRQHRVRHAIVDSAMLHTMGFAGAAITSRDMVGIVDGQIADPTQRGWETVRLRDGETTVEAGTLNPSAIVAAMHAGAQKAGVSYQHGHSVDAWGQTADARWWVDVAGQRYVAERLVVATGAWTPDFMASLAADSVDQTMRTKADSIQQRLFTMRVPLFFCQWPDGLAHCMYRMPANSGKGHIYAMPEVDAHSKTPLLKFGFHQGVPQPELTAQTGLRPHYAQSPDQFAAADWMCDPILVETALAEMESLLGCALQPIRHAYCYYGNTPSAKPLMDTLDRDGTVALCVGHSGGGFKFVGALGMLVCDLLGLTNRPLVPEFEAAKTPFLLQTFMK